jgi:hypothetical protein
VPCEHDKPELTPRRELVDVPTGPGQTDDIRLGDYDPQVSGWLISIASVTKVAAALPNVIIDGLDNWLGSAALHFGDQNAGIQVNNGGRIYVPYPTVRLSFFDQNGSGGASPQLSVLGRPLRGYEAAGFSTVAVGTSQATIANAGTNAFNVPLGASSYWVSRPDNGGTVEVLCDDGVGNSVSEYVLDANDVSYPLPAPSPWRDVPLFAGDTNSTIEVTNNTGGGQLFVVHWRFDLAAMR